MNLKELEDQLKSMRKRGATDTTEVRTGIYGGGTEIITSTYSENLNKEDTGTPFIIIYI